MQTYKKIFIIAGIFVTILFLPIMINYFANKENWERLACAKVFDKKDYIHKSLVAENNFSMAEELMFYHAYCDKDKDKYKYYSNLIKKLTCEAFIDKKDYINKVELSESNATLCDLLAKYHTICKPDKKLALTFSSQSIKLKLNKFRTQKTVN